MPQPVSERCLFATPNYEVVEHMMQEIKLRIVEQDIGRLFESTGKILSKLSVQFKSVFPDLDDRAYRALLGICYPAFDVANKTLRQSVNYVNRLAANDETLNIFELGLSKYFIAEGIFSLRTAHSISLAESQMTKWFLYVMRHRLEKENSLLKYAGLATHEGINPE
jgi:hypothetical protein